MACLAGSVPLGPWYYQLVRWQGDWVPGTEASGIGQAADTLPAVQQFGLPVVVDKRQPVFRRRVPEHKLLLSPPLVAGCLAAVEPARRRAAGAGSDARTHWEPLASWSQSGRRPHRFPAL